MENNLKSAWYRGIVGSLFLAVGVGLNWISNNSDSITAIVCGEDPGVFCKAVELAVLELGFKAVAYTLIVLGCILIALYDFVANVLGSILSFALNHITNSKQVVLDAMSQNRINQQESSEIIVETISRFKGYKDRNSLSFAKYCHENLIKQNAEDNGFWRNNFSSVIDVRSLETGDDLPNEKYMKWIESGRYSISNEVENQVYNYSSFSSIEVDNPDNLEKIFASLKYIVRVGGKLEFSIDAIRASIDVGKVKSGDQVEAGPCKIHFVDDTLNIWVDKTVTVPGFETDVVVDEESFIMVDDNVYELQFFEPTKGFSFRFNLPEGYEVYHSGASGTRFGSRNSEDVVVSQDTANRVRVDGASWGLPGIVSVFVWKKA